MKSRLAVGIASALVVMLSVAGMGIVTAKPQAPIVMGLAGAFVNVDSQEYHSAGSNATLVSILGTQLPRSSYNFSYSINASVQGTAVSGGDRFELHVGESANTNNSSVSVEGKAQLVDRVPAVGFPITDP